MTPLCSVCGHPDEAVIDAAIAERDGLARERQLAASLGVEAAEMRRPKGEPDEEPPS